MTAPRCPRCGASWDPDRECALCGAREDGSGCVPETEAAMRWCRKHGIEPMTSVRCSLQVLERRGRRVAATVVFAVLAVVAAGQVEAQQLYCHELTGCWAHPSPFGMQCTTTPNTAPCPVTTPTPTATPVPTVTPTPPPVSYTITEFLKARDLGYSYIMAMTMLDGALFLTGGVCCPGIGDGIGECLAAIDYTVTPPVHREFVCSYRDSSELWEVVAAQVVHSDLDRWVVTGENTRRPATTALQTSGTASHVWGFGVRSITDPNFRWLGGTGTLISPEPLKRWPLAILDLDGIRYLYTMVLPLDSNYYWNGQALPMGSFALQRFSWPGAYRTALYTTTTHLAVLKEPLSPIAIDADGSLISTVDVDPPALKLRMRAAPAGITVAPMWYPSSAATKIRVVRSRDQGRTWSDTGIVINAPTGKTLWGCGWDHKSGGAATIPWHLLCVISTGKGPEVGDWNGASVRFNGATVPANFGQKPVIWK